MLERLQELSVELCVAIFVHPQKLAPERKLPSAGVRRGRTQSLVACSFLATHLSSAFRMRATQDAAQSHRINSFNFCE